MTTHKDASKNQKRGTSGGHGFSKTSKRFWKDRLFTRTTADYWVRMKRGGRDDKFCLHTAHADKATEKARDIYLMIIAEGWDAALRQFKPNAKSRLDGPSMSVGQFLEAARAVSDVRATTWTIYVRKFRHLVAGVCRIKGDKRRFGKHGAKTWQEAVDRIPLSKLTPDKIAKWKTAKVQKVANDPIKRKHARITADSVLRSSKSLFADKIVRHFQGKVPNPFEGIEIGSTYGGRYRSKTNPQLMAQLAAKELKTQYPSQYLMFILALAVGLRRGEIDRLEWKHVDLARNTISIETTEMGAPKTDDSDAEVDIDPALAQVLKEFKSNGTGTFVVSSKTASMGATHWHRYRCNDDFRALTSWLRSKGVDNRNPIHTLRKEFGSLMADQGGIFAASTALRHASITLTKSTYVDKKSPISLDMEGLL